jgi:hypothetical protein
VEPGGHCPVEIAWDTHGRSGQAETSVRVVYTLATDPVDTKEVELRLSGNILPPVSYKPPKLSFDPSGAIQVQTVDVIPLPGEQADVVAAVVNHPAMTTEIVEGRSVRIKFDPVAWKQVPAGNGVTLFVKTTNLTDAEHAIPIVCEVSRKNISGN